MLPMNPSSAVDVVTGSVQLQTQQATAAIVQELLLKINASGLSAHVSSESIRLTT
jgi:hypothetical protein